MKAPSEPSPEAGLDRRGFLLGAAGGLISAATLLSGLAAAVRFLVPNVRYEPSPRVVLGPPERYPDGITYLEGHRIYLVRANGGFRALSGICTHLGCSVARDDSGRGFRCPCHGSRFNDSGDVLEGPAPRPLPWLAMERAADGRLVVDRSRPVSETALLRI